MMTSTIDWNVIVAAVIALGALILAVQRIVAAITKDVRAELRRLEEKQQADAARFDQVAAEYRAWRMAHDEQDRREHDQIMERSTKEHAALADKLTALDKSLTERIVALEVKMSTIIDLLQGKRPS